MLALGNILAKVRLQKPLVHHLTNNVTMGDCADATMSIGALPVMAHALQEVEEMVAAARAAVLNIGTLYPDQVDSMLAMGKKAREFGIPVVLDPVGAGATSYRTEVAELILRTVRPVVIKGNGGEIGTLAGMGTARVSGVHSMDGGGDPARAARALLGKLDYEAVVAVTGAVDLLTDGRQTVRIKNGHPLLPMVVGSGCMAASLVASFAAVEKNKLHAAAAALAAMSIAGELAAAAMPADAAESSPAEAFRAGKSIFGPACFKAYLLDVLYYLTPAELDRRAKIEVE